MKRRGRREQEGRPENTGAIVGKRSVMVCQWFSGRPSCSPRTVVPHGEHDQQNQPGSILVEAVDEGGDLGDIHGLAEVAVDVVVDAEFLEAFGFEVTEEHDHELFVLWR